MFDLCGPWIHTRLVGRKMREETTRCLAVLSFVRTWGGTTTVAPVAFQIGFELVWDPYHSCVCGEMLHAFGLNDGS